MKNKYNLSVKKLIYSYFVSIMMLSSTNAQDISDLIKPLKIYAGKPDTVLISDLFYAKDYNLTFRPNRVISTKYILNKKILILQADSAFEGYTLIKFNLDDNMYFLPVKSEIRQTHIFRFQSRKKPKKLTLFGSFNSWNRDNLPLADKNENGIYEINVALDPGRYEYKFFEDGQEILDPYNPVKVPNGFGGFNSVIIIPPRHNEMAYLHILGYRKENSRIKFSFYFDRSGIHKLITAENVIGLINNQKISAGNISVNNDTVKISFLDQILQGEKIIRVAVTQDGISSNLQTVYLYNGIPAGSRENYSLHDDIIYSIMIDRFYDGDKRNNKPVISPEIPLKTNYQGGDFQGIIDKLNEGYFDSLGVNALWISPVVDNPNSAYRETPPLHRYYSAYHGYWPLSINKVEEHFGNMSLLKKLVSLAHKHHIKILMDFVAHHVFINNTIYQKHPDWFGVLTLPDGRKNLRLWDEHRLTTWFEPYLPTFNYSASKDALKLMTDNAVWWLKETGADGFRHDAVKHVPNIFWRTLTKKIEREIEIPEHRNIYQIGETFGSYDLVNSYVNNGQLSAQFNFNLYDVALPTFLEKNNSFAALDGEIKKSFEVYGVNNLMGNIMDSHDKVRYLAYADSDITLNSGDAAQIGWENPPEVNYPSSYKKERLYLAYLLTIPGIPVIDYGDEIGMTGAADPDNRRMMRFGNQLASLEKEDLTKIKELINLRKNHSALRYGGFQSFVADNNCYVYLRSDMNERILIALNKSETEQNVTIQLPKFYDIKHGLNLINNSILKINSDKIAIKIPPIGYQILKLTE